MRRIISTRVAPMGSSDSQKAGEGHPDTAITASATTMISAKSMKSVRSCRTRTPIGGRAAPCRPLLMRSSFLAAPRGRIFDPGHAAETGSASGTPRVKAPLALGIPTTDSMTPGTDQRTPREGLREITSRIGGLSPPIREAPLWGVTNLADEAARLGELADGQEANAPPGGLRGGGVTPPRPAAVHEAAEVAGQAPRGERSAAGGDRVADRRGVLVQLSGEPGLGGAAERTEDVEFAREAGQRALRVEPTAHGRDTSWPGAFGTQPTICQFGTES